MSLPTTSHTPVFKSSVVASSAEHRANRAAYLSLLARFRAMEEVQQRQGRPRRQAAARKQGKMLGRERLELLLDEDSPFLEICSLAGHGVKGQPEGSGMVGGIGVVAGVECMVVAYVPTVGAGAMTPEAGQKWERLAQVSRENRLPFVTLLESAGADLGNAFPVFHTHPGPFYTLSRLSGANIPTVTVVFGTCIAGGAYLGGLSDYVVMVRGHAQLALAGTKLVQVATGERSTDDELGSAEMHTRVSGSSEYLAASEPDALRLARELLGQVRVEKRTTFDGAFLPEARGGLPPALDSEELLGLVPTAGGGHPNVDCREIMARIVDGSELFEFKPEYGPTMVTCWARVHGVPVGVIGNNGVIFHQSAQKAAHFIGQCNRRGVPVVYIHNVTGFMVGKQYEHSGILKWGSQMISAMSNSHVPNISVLTGSSFGAAYYGMCGRGYMPRFLFSWPSARCHVMGPDQLSGVMELLGRERIERAGGGPEAEERLAAATERLRATVERQASPAYYSPRLIDDGVIDPRDTRDVLGICLSVCCNERIERGFVGGVGRL